MRKNILYMAFGMVAALLALTACSEDELDPESVITIDKQIATENDLDRWLDANFLAPYNIQIKYRYEDNESNMSYYEVPSRIEDATALAHILKYCCLEAYDAAVGIDFTRRQFPKLFFFTGEWRYSNNGSFTLGTAEGGKKVFLMGTRYEFTHILNQTQPYSTTYKLITADGYVADTWNSSPNNAGYLGRGFISAYSQKEDREDFAEIMAMYVTNTVEQWEAWMQQAEEETEEGKPSGRELIEQKLGVVRDYMLKSWDIDMDVLRAEILRRQDDIAAGRIDLTDLTIH